jgi:hypothetical protein
MIDRDVDGAVAKSKTDSAPDAAPQRAERCAYYILYKNKKLFYLNLPNI